VKALSLTPIAIIYQDAPLEPKS